MCKFLTHYIYIKYYYNNIYWSETPVGPPAIKNATLFTRTHQGTLLSQIKITIPQNKIFLIPYLANCQNQKVMECYVSHTLSPLCYNESSVLASVSFQSKLHSLYWKNHKVIL